MKEVFKIYLGVFFLFLIIACSFSSISAAVDARKADDFKTAIIDDIENSDFNTGRIEDIFSRIDTMNAESIEKVGKPKYTVRMTFYRESDGNRTTSREPVSTAAEFRNKIGDTTGVYMATVELDFRYSMPLINVMSTHTIMGYAK